MSRQRTWLGGLLRRELVNGGRCELIECMVRAAKLTVEDRDLALLAVKCKPAVERLRGTLMLLR
jgi:hypothetical protein